MGSQRGGFHEDDVLREVIHQQDALVSVHVQLVDEAEPVDHQTRPEPASKWGFSKNHMQ